MNKAEKKLSETNSKKRKTKILKIMKILLIAAATFGLLYLTSIRDSEAQESFYLGLHRTQSNLNLSDKQLTSSIKVNSKDYYNNSLGAYGFNFGYEPKENINFEISYYEDEAKKSNNNTGLVYTSGSLTGQNITTKTKLRARVLDAKISYMHNIYEALDGFVGVGPSIIDIKASEYYNNGDKLSESFRTIAPSIGLGFRVRYSGLGFSLSYNKTLINQRSSKLNGFSKIKDMDSIKGSLNIFF